MQRRKILLWSFFFLLIVACVFYIFRYSLILQFQYSRLNSLKCKGDCFDRVWVHRVNSVERYSALKDKFKGFETDIIFDTTRNQFFVLHPPAVERGDTILLDTFLYKTFLNSKHFWFDTRFVDSSNVMKAWGALNSLAHYYNIPDNCILEVYYPQVAQFLAGSLYTVCFNVSERWLNSLPNNKELLDSLNKMLVNVPYVSQEAKYLPILKKLFPNKKILTWELSAAAYLNRKRFQRILDDPQVEVVLVNVKSRYYR